jgi:hypothetical protein
MLKNLKIKYMYVSNGPKIPENRFNILQYIKLSSVRIKQRYFYAAIKKCSNLQM